MNKRWLPTILVALLLVAGGAMYAFYRPSLGGTYEVSVSPPQTEPRGQLDFPREEFSTLSLRVEVPVNVLAALANEKLPRDISGRENKNFHEKISNGLIEYRIIPGEISLQGGQGQLQFSVPLQGAARVSGEVDVRILRLPVQGGADIAGLVTGSAKPSVSEDWRLVPNLIPNLNLSRASLILGRIGSIDATQLIQQLADPLVKKEAAKLNDAFDIKPPIQKLWDEAHLNQKISTDPEAWIHLDPGDISIGSLDYSQPGVVSLAFAMKARSQVSSSKGNHPYPEVLPKPVLTTEPPPTNARIPVIADLNKVNEELKDQVFQEKGTMGSALEVRELEVRLGRDGLIYLGMNVDADSGALGYKLKGRLWIQGKPRLDVARQTITFAEIALTPESMAAFPASAAQIINSQLAEHLERELVVDLREHLADWERELQRQISAAAPSEDISLLVGQPALQLLDLYTVSRPEDLAELAPALVVVLGVQVKVTARINKL